MTENLSHLLFRPELLSLSAYHVADARGYIKLDAMENPYSWPEALQQQWLDSLKSVAINRYPDPSAPELAQAIRINQGIPEQSALLLGNGSDEIIQILLMAVKADASILAPEPSFVMYRQVAKSLGLNYIGVPLLADSFELDINTMLDIIAERQPSLIFLAYPNNPTGNLFDKTNIIKLLEASKGLVIVDEAYAPFADASFLSELVNYDNLLVMRTLSKLGLAGLRLGFLVGKQSIINELDKIRLPYNINCLTQSTASFALNHGDFLLSQTQSLCQQRTWVFNALQSFTNIKVYPSAANFILFKTLTLPADTVFNALKERGILIKNLSPQQGLLHNCLRVTIGT